MAEDETYNVNVEWTVDSIKKTLAEGKSRVDICFSCAKEHIPVKTYQVAIANNKLQWTDGQGPVYEKIRVQYCDACAEEMIKSLEESELPPV